MASENPHRNETRKPDRCSLATDAVVRASRDRHYCAKCGGHVIVGHPTLGLTDVRIGALQNFPFTPKVHLHYEETVLPMRDGLPKLKDFQPAIGGSGQTLPQ